jgi:hypothetical protein
VEPRVMTNRSKRQPHANKPNTRKQDLRNTGKDRFTPTGNDRIVDQNRKVLGKHYANKYLIAQ